MIKREGFTLIELLVVIAIFGLLVVSGVLSMKKFNTDRNLDLTIQEMMSTIARAQSLASAPDRAGATGYGVYFNHGPSATPFNERLNNYYVLFDDKNNNQEYDSGEAIDQPKKVEKGVFIQWFYPLCQKTPPCDGDGASLVFTTAQTGVDNPDEPYNPGLAFERKTFFQGYIATDPIGDPAKPLTYGRIFVRLLGSGKVIKIDLTTNNVEVGGW